MLKTLLGQLGKGKRITLSKTQLKKFGGFLPFLIPLLTTLATGALRGAPKKSGVLQNWERRDIIPQLLNHPAFLYGLRKLLLELTRDKKKVYWKRRATESGISNEVIERNLKG